MKKNNYIAPMTEVFNLYTEGMMAASGLSEDGGDNKSIDISDEVFDNDFQSRKKGGVVRRRLKRPTALVALKLLNSPVCPSHRRVFLYVLFRQMPGRKCANGIVTSNGRCRASMRPVRRFLCPETFP